MTDAPSIAIHIRICPHCFESTGDTFEFVAVPPVSVTCEDCGSRLQLYQPIAESAEGWLRDRDYSETYEAA